MLLDTPDEIMQAHGMGFWLRSVGRVAETADGKYVSLCERVLGLAREDDAADAESPVDKALNHPIGQVVEGLFGLRVYCSQGGEGLPALTKSVLERVCDLSAERYRIGRVMVASRVLPLLVRDEAWTREHVLPMFDWNRSAQDACPSMGVVFLAAPHFHEGFLDLVRKSFVRAARHYDELGCQGNTVREPASVRGVLRLRSGWSTSLREAIDEMPDEGLQQMLSTIRRALEVDERREDYIKNRVLPFLRRLWPKTTDKLTPDISVGFVRLCLVAEDAFPEVFPLRAWISIWGQPTTAGIRGALLEG